MSIKDSYDYVVLGAGISGLSAGYALFKHKQDFAILEKSHRAGGVIESEIIDGLMVEHGPNSMALTPEVEALCNELGIMGDLLPAMEQSKIRQILWDDKLHTLKASPLTLISTKLLSTRAKLRILKEPFISSTSPASESVLSFFKRRFGKQVAQRMAGAIVSGIYAGDAAQLGIASVFPRFVELEKKYGSLLKGLKKAPAAPRKIISFNSGMETLTSTLSRKLTSHLQLNTTVTFIEKQAGHWLIAYDNTHTIKARNIITTLPYYSLEQLVTNLNFPQVSIPYNPMLTMQVEVDLKELHSRTSGFGFLASSFERKDFIGVLYNGNVFKTALHKDKALLNFFVRPDYCKLKEPQQIFDQLCVPLLRKWTGITTDLKLIHSRLWKLAIPQKETNHLVKLEAIKQWETSNHGFYTAGNFIYGVSVGDCITDHLHLVRNLLKHNAL